jgi:adenine-specific DNA glycosylase
MEDKIPMRKEKKKLQHRYFHYLVLTDHGHVWLHKRTGNDIWHSLYEFPLAEMPAGKQPDAEAGTKLPAFQIFSLKKSQKPTGTHLAINDPCYVLPGYIPPGHKQPGDELVRVPVQSIGTYPLRCSIARYLADSGTADYRQKG